MKRVLEQPPLGAHMSIAGGVDLAIDRAREAGCSAFQIFLKNNNRWRGKPLDEAAIERFRAEMARGDFAPPVAHASYLLNLASPDAGLRKKTRENLADDLNRAGRLGVVGVVLHPGAHMGQGESKAIERIAAEIDRILGSIGGDVAIYLENTAGQGTSIGHRFEHLRDILAGVPWSDRMGVCLDTCHLLAAGYDLRTEKAVRTTMREFDRVVGLEWLRVFHFNDSKRPLGSRVDRHTHIGEGCIGDEGFVTLMRMRSLSSIPRILETPKGKGPEGDRRNLERLRALAHSARAKRP